MSTHKSDAGAYLRWIVASEYYDGAIAGIGQRSADGATVWFRVVAWDEEQWRRVFAVTAVAPSRAEELVRDLEKAEPRKVPFWLPGPTSVTPETKKGWGEVADAAARSGSWHLVEAHDLNEPYAERLVPAADVSRLIAGIRAGSVLAVRGSSLTDDFLHQVRCGS
jgi:hypothetical protein